VPAVAALDLEVTIAAELAAPRPELEQLVRERVRFALAELTRELVAAELSSPSNGAGNEGAAEDGGGARPGARRSREGAAVSQSLA